MAIGDAVDHSARAADELAGQRPRELVLLDRDDARAHCRHVSAGSLDESTGAGGEVERHARRLERQAVVVDHVEIGLHPRRDHPPVEQPVQLGGVPGLALHDVFEREARPSAAVARPVREHERGRTAVADRAAVGAGVAESHPRARVPLELVAERQVAVGVVEEREVQHPVAVVGEELVEDELHRRPAPGRCQRGDRVFGGRLVVDVAVGDRVHPREPLGDGFPVEVVARHLVDEAPLPVRVPERNQALGHRQERDLVIRGMEHQRVQRAVEAHQDADRAAGRLGDDRYSLRSCLVQQREHVAPDVGAVVGLVEVDAHGSAGAPGQLAHPPPLLGRHGEVVGRELEHAVAGATEGVADAEQFVGGGGGAGDELAGLRAMDGCARRREAERAGVQRGFHESRHLGDVGGRRRFVGGAPLAHDVGPQRAVSDLRAHVQHSRLPFDRVEVLGVGLPVPRDALDHRRPRNVLDAFHQLDQPLAAVRCGGREPDAAVAHDHGRDAVPRRRGEHRVPAHLGVVVRVDVDPPWCYEAAVGVDHPMRCSHVVTDGDDAIAIDGDVRPSRRAAGSVDELSVPDHEVVHARPTIRGRSQCGGARS